MNSPQATRIIQHKRQKIIQEERELSKTFSKIFVSIVKNLGINKNLLCTSSSETRNVESIIAKFKNHPSIVTIHNHTDIRILYSPLQFVIFNP